MSAADKRIAELLDRWLASVDLHAQYVELDDADYARIQDWPKHERPSRWVIELARQRLEELKRHVRRRADEGDEGFADALELMSFLTSLLGAEQVERFVPLARPRPVQATVRRQNRQESKDARSGPQAASRLKPAVKAAVDSSPVLNARQEAPERPRKASSVARPQPRKAPERPRKASSVTRPQPRKAPAQPPPPRNPEMTATVIADAVRLLSWGREWPQIAGLVARLSNRPAEKEIWEILRQNRAAIEAKATQASH